MNEKIKIEDRFNGFQNATNFFGQIAPYIVRDQKKIALFAFTVSNADLITKKYSLETLNKMAKSIIYQFIEKNKISNKKEYTFEFDPDSNVFILKKKVGWWVYGKN